MTEKGPYRTSDGRLFQRPEVVTDHIPPDPCPECDGDGELLIRFNFSYQVQNCWTCGGSGVVAR